jgi:DNA mismatch repair protein MutH
VSELLSLEDAVQELLAAYSGQSVAELAHEIDTGDLNLHGKSAHAFVIRRLLEQRGLAAGLAERGVTVKVVRRDEDGDPIEKMTFRNFDHEAFPRETWETSEMRSETRELLIIVFDAVRGEPIATSALAGGFFWTPTDEQDHRIVRDWRLCREAIAYHLGPPKEKDTDVVHVATKGRDSDDVEEGAHGATYRKECLALNKKFVAEILAGGMPTRGGS